MKQLIRAIDWINAKLVAYPAWFGSQGNMGEASLDGRLRTDQQARPALA